MSNSWTQVISRQRPMSWRLPLRCESSLMQTACRPRGEKQYSATNADWRASKGEGDGLGMAAGTVGDQSGGALPRGQSAARAAVVRRATPAADARAVRGAV